MRYAILADIHANLHALEAVLSHARGEGADRYLVAGDLVGYGPFPNECIQRVAELGATCVAGNHDLIVLGVLADDRCIPLARRSLAWTQEVLHDDARAYLAALPRHAEAEGGILVTHGSLDHAWEYTTRPEQAVRQLARLESEFGGARTLVVGHTHRPWACDESGWTFATSGRGRLSLGRARLLLNPGAVGQSRELRVRARYVLVDLDDKSAVFHALRYDSAACREALRQRGLSDRSHHLRPSARGAVRRLGTALRRVG